MPKTSIGQNEPAVTGGDLYRLVATWSQLWRTAAFTAIFFTVFFTGVATALYVFKRSGIRIQTGSNGTTIQFDELDRTLRFDTILIAPQDWNDPGIVIKKGDVIIIKAYGRVNVAAGLMNRALEQQYRYREENERAGRTRDVPAMTAEQVGISRLSVPWSGPEGIDPSLVMDKEVKQTQEREAATRIVPNERMGRLISAVVPGDACPKEGSTSREMQLVPYNGDGAFTAASRGRLCFIVNDHRSENPNFNRLFWDDNIGFYSASVRIESR